jgi:cellulose synthase operon protein C
LVDHSALRAWHSSLLAVASLFVAVLASAWSNARAQDGVAFGRIPAEVAQPRVSRPRGETMRRLERLSRLVEQRSWDEMCTVADELLANDADGWVALEPHRYVGVREAVHRQIASLPAEGLAAYRRRVDSLAEEWLVQGVETRDEPLLRRVVDEAFCSSAGDDALWALGEIALERGDCQAARARWQQIHAETAGDARLAYPDSSIELAEVRARLALVSIREQDFDRAEREVAEFKLQYPDAVGRLGGQRAKLGERLAELLAEARSWPAAPSRPSGWPALMANDSRTSVSPLALPTSADFEQAWSIDFTAVGADARLIPEATTYPIVANDVALFRDAEGIATVELTPSGDSTRAKHIFETSTIRLPAENWAVTARDDKVLAVIAVAKRGEGGPTTRLVGLDLSRDGALLLNEGPTAADALYTGPPVVNGSRVVVGELSPGQGANAAVVCYDLWTGKVAWRQTLGSGFHIVAPGRPPAFEVSVSLAAGALYVNTNLGMIAALRTEDGAPLWLHTYRRALGEAAPEEPGGLPTSKQRPHPCVLAGSRVIVAPADHEGVLALDAASGEEFWSAPLPAAEARLLAVDGNRVILSGERLWAVDADTGKLDPQWGEGLSGGMGQGAVAGEAILWPTTGEILLVDRSTGKPAGRSISLPTGGGANLAMAKLAESGEIYVVAAGPAKMTAYRAITSSPLGEVNGDNGN